MPDSAIPYFYKTLSRKFECFDPFLSEWDDIELSQLQDLDSFLEEEYEGFQERVVEDIHLNYSAKSLVSDINRTLRTFMSWTEQLPEEMLNPADGDDEKAQLLREITLKVGFLWIPWLSDNYAPISEASPEVPLVMPVEVRIEESRKSKKEQLAEEYRNDIFSKIIGATFQEKERIFTVLKSLVQNKGGSDLAPYLQAAKELKLITGKPKFPAMEMFWKVTKTSQALSRYMTDNDCFINEDIVESKKKEINHMLDACN